MTYSEAISIWYGSDTTMQKILWGRWQDGTQPTQGYLHYWLGSASNSSGVWFVWGYNKKLEKALYSNNNDGVRPVLIVYN